MKFVCQTLFDITATGTTGHPKATRWPCRDRSGQIIADTQAWNRSRNQQRNWETLQQILSLRTQITAITDPVIDATGTRWMFEFETDTPGAFGPNSDPTAVLRMDADGVPMLRDGVSETVTDTCLLTQGLGQNIWFAAVPINT
jgi:hypothetical protein